MARELVTALVGFPPIEGEGAESLILGSFPSERSLELQQYYGHAQNRFWRVLAPLSGSVRDAPYATRVSALREARIAVWDVIAECQRPKGSLDSAIIPGSEVPNPIGDLIARHPGLRRILLNGRKAAATFGALIVPEEHWNDLGVRICVLPSASPANAAVGLVELQRVWGEALRRQ